MALASWKPRGRLSDGPPNIFSNKDIFHASSFRAPVLKPNKDTSLPFQRLSMSPRFVPALFPRRGMSARSKVRHLTFPGAWAASSGADSVWPLALGRLTPGHKLHSCLRPGGVRGPQAVWTSGLVQPLALFSQLEGVGVGWGQGGFQSPLIASRPEPLGCLHVLHDQAPTLVTSAKPSCGPDSAELSDLPGASLLPPGVIGVHCSPPALRTPPPQVGTCKALNS